MANPFEIARDWARLVDAGKEGDEVVGEMLRKFPGVTAAELRRAELICLERLTMLEEERQAAAYEFAEKWYSGPEAEKFFGGRPAKQVIDTAATLYLMDMPLRPIADALFPKPDKSKS